MEVNKPIIGIVMHSYPYEKCFLQGLNDNYRQAVLKSGGIPIGIFSTQKTKYNETAPSKMPRLTDKEKETLILTLNFVDGLIFPGGNRWYEYDEFICLYALENKIPILGICMGMQLMAAVDTRISSEEFSRPIKNLNDEHNKNKEYTHNVVIDTTTKLYSILKENMISVNSMHSYHIEKTNKFIISAISEDNIPEAIELSDHPFALAVQWHPEKLFDKDKNSQTLFLTFIEETKKYKTKKN